MSDRWEVAIVGAGVAGSALALHLGRLGLRTVVFDKARFPRRKACGEGLLPHGAAELKSLGLGDPPGTRVDGLRYFSPSGDSAAARFDESGLGPGWVVHRDILDHWLLRHARATPNVTIKEASTLTLPEVEELRANVVVGADGLRSIFHKRAPFRRTTPRRVRAGMSAVVHGYPAADTVDVYLGSGGEAYVGPGAPGETSLALLLEKGVKPADLLAKIPAFRDIEIVRPFIGVSPLGSRVEPVVAGRVLLLGDAAGAVDPISGDGLSLALLSARAAATAIRRAVESDDPAALEPYAEARRKLMAPAARMAALLLKVTRRPWFANRAVRKLSRDAGLFGRLLRAACGEGSLSLLDPARLVL